MSHVRIFGAEVAVSSAALNLVLRNVTIESNVRGVRTTGDGSNKLRIEDSSVNANAQEGVYVQAQGEVVLVRSSFKDSNMGVRSGTLSKLYINGCAFKNINYGHYTTGVLSDVLISNSNFSGVSHGLYLAMQYHRKSYNITIKNCTFSEHRQRYNEALYVGLSSSAYRVSVLGCLFQDNTRGITVSGYGNSGSKVLLGNITMLRHTSYAINFPYVSTQVEILDSTFLDNGANTITFSWNRGGGLKMRNCRFEANAGDHVVRWSQKDKTSFINDNTFVNNTATTTVVFYDGNLGQLFCSNNAFSNPRATFELRIESNWADSYAVRARNNWWGTNNMTSIRSRIRDFFLDMTRAEVLLSPIYEDSSMDSMNTANFSTDFGYHGDKLGGRLTNDTVLSVHSLTTVGLTIHVPRGKKLTILANDTLEFEENIGILVEGNCQIIIRLH